MSARMRSSVTALPSRCIAADAHRVRPDFTAAYGDCAPRWRRGAAGPSARSHAWATPFPASKATRSPVPRP